MAFSNEQKSLLRFLTGIMPELNWDKLFFGPEKFTTEEICIQSPEKLGELYTPWRDKNGVYADGCDNSANAICVKDASSYFRKWHKENELFFYRNIYNVQDYIHTEIFAYKIEEENFFILDGGHRAVSIYESGKPFSLKMKVICGPIKESILIDLKKWQIPNEG